MTNYWTEGDEIVDNEEALRRRWNDNKNFFPFPPWPVNRIAIYLEVYHELERKIKDIVLRKIVIGKKRGKIMSKIFLGRKIFRVKLEKITKLEEDNR